MVIENLGLVGGPWLGICDVMWCLGYVMRLGVGLDAAFKVPWGLMPSALVCLTAYLGG